MEKEAGRGITKVCSNCKHIILSEGSFFGIGWFKIKCPNLKCMQYQRIRIGQTFALTVSALAIIGMVFGYASAKSQAKRNINCSIFKSQSEAQDTFESDMIKYRNLDKNNNSIACEEYHYK